MKREEWGEESALYKIRIKGEFGRERVLRWLARRSKAAAEHAERVSNGTALGRAAVLAELVDDFANGRER